MSNAFQPLVYGIRRLFPLSACAVLLFTGCIENRDAGELSAGEQREVERIIDDPRTSLAGIQRRSPTRLEIWTQQGNERRRYIISTGFDGEVTTVADLPGEPLARNRGASLPTGQQRRLAD